MNIVPLFVMHIKPFKQEQEKEMNMISLYESIIKARSQARSQASHQDWQGDKTVEEKHLKENLSRGSSRAS